ncbi:MAG: hypothetical protein WCD11_00465 [Solirubrobacteraceae bacterium]
MTRVATLGVALALALAAVAVAPAGAVATTLVNETFSHSTPDNPNWLVGGMVGTNSVDPCLTAGTNTSQTPIPDCPANQPAIPRGGDSNGQGAAADVRHGRRHRFRAVPGCAPVHRRARRYVQLL